MKKSIQSVEALDQEVKRELLKEGYVEMAAEARAVARAFEALDRETLLKG